jgi:hypothetical protein
MLLTLLACSDYNLSSKDDVPEGWDTAALSECWFDANPAMSIPQVEECVIEPVIGTFTPVQEWTQSAPGDVYTTPVVGFLTADEVPDIAVGNYAGQVYVLSGDTGQVVWSGGSLGSEPMTPAIADIDGDGDGDVVIAGSTGVFAFDGPTGAQLWSSGELPNGASPNCGAVALHDLEGDGTVEVVIGAMVLEGATGALRFKGSVGAGAGHAWAAPMGVAADVMGLGRLQVIVGNAIYDTDGSILWQNGQGDGFVAVGNFDGDPEGEIVVARTGTLRLQDHNGTVLWTRPNLTGSTIGPPTIADFNNDGRPEIGVAGNGVYMVVDEAGQTLWSRPTVDYSSGFTGSAVFDFEGDGAAEVVYADENDVWVFNGINGEVKMKEDRHSSATCSEYPTIADVDNDGHAEIIYASGAFSGQYETGVTVIGDSNDSWRAGSRAWNQHAYYLTNVNDDGTIPTSVDTNWLSYNTFRSGDLSAGQRGEYADLIVEIEDVCQELCDGIVVWGRIGNQGVVAVEDDVLVELKAVTPDGHVSLGVQVIAGPVSAGKMLPSFSFEADVTDMDVRALVLLVDEGNDSVGWVAECNEDNNQDVFSETVCE